MDGGMRGMDVAVLGGGPAGLAAALALRRQGLRVTLYDAQRPPIDKACGEGLMPQSVRILEGLGVSLGDGNGGCIAGISFHEGMEAACGRFRDGPGMGVRRTCLHELLAAEAVKAGIRLHWSAVVQANAGGFISAGSQIHAGFFVIADGLCSTLAHAAGFRQQVCSSRRYAFRQPFRCAPWSDMVEVHWGKREQIYVTPIGAEEVNIALLTGRRDRRLSDALADFPVVARRLAKAERTAAARGAVTRTCMMRQVVRGNLALIGDASGAVDAITGEGLLSAFRQAVALAEALSTGKLERYTEAHRRIARTPGRMARLLLLLDRHPMLRRRSIAALAAHPECFAKLLGVHLGEQSYLQALRSVAGEIIRGRTPVWPTPYKERGL
jgi:flavin-dependent dehydrogenase